MTKPWLPLIEKNEFAKHAIDALSEYASINGGDQTRKLHYATLCVHAKVVKHGNVVSWFTRATEISAKAQTTIAHSTFGKGDVQ